MKYSAVNQKSLTTIIRRLGMCVVVLVLIVSTGYISACASPVVNTTIAELPTFTIPTEIQHPISLTGMGTSTLARLAYLWSEQYNTTAGTKMNYQAVGGRTAVIQMLEGVVNFAVTESTFTADQIIPAESDSEVIVAIPAAVGAVAVAYNLPDAGEAALRLTGTVLADIYLGKIKRWDDPALRELNPDLELPGEEIIVCYHKGASDLTYIFSDYLGRVSSSWLAEMGTGVSFSWPCGLAEAGSNGVARRVWDTPYAIGYTEPLYLSAFHVTGALIENHSGHYVSYDIEAISRAVDGTVVADGSLSGATDSPADGAYPIVGYIWLYVFRDQPDENQGRALAEYLWWLIHDGQQHAGTVEMAPLPEQAVSHAEMLIRSMVHGNSQLFSN